MSTPPDQLPYLRDSSSGPGLYVIVGRGYCAVLNHLTLRQTEWGRRRLGERSVLHVGFDDPWSHYLPHRMGQFPHLLALPGYRESFSGEPAYEVLVSTAFARATQTEFERLAAEHGTGVHEPCNAWVAAIQPRDGERREFREEVRAALREEEVDAALLDSDYPSHYPPYRLLIVLTEAEGPVSHLLYAWRVDLCVGSGIPNLVPRECVDPQMWEGYAGRAWHAPESGSRSGFMVPGQHALYQNNALPGSDHTLCVYGLGGISLNLVETRIASGRVDWMADRSHRHGDNQRNNCLYATPNTTHPGVLPATDRLRLGEWVDVEKVTLEGVKFRPRKGESVIIDSSGNATRLEEQPFFRYRRPAAAEDGEQGYHQLLVSRGLRTDRIPGTVDFMIKLLPDPILRTAHDGRVIAVESPHAEDPDGGVRILGSAALTFPEDSLLRGSAAAATDDYHDSLPVQARVRGWNGITGITYNGIAVALANQYFSGERPNRDVNTASYEELQVVLGDEDLVHAIFKVRADPIGTQGGFPNRAALDAALGEHARGRETLLDRLRYTPGY